MMSRILVAAVCLLGVAQCKQWGDYFSCGGTCCDSSDSYKNWPCASWTNDHMTGRCGWDNAGHHRCECKDGYSGADCNGGAGGGSTAAKPCAGSPCSGLGVTCDADSDCTDGNGCVDNRCHKKCTKNEDCGVSGATCDNRGGNEKFCSDHCLEIEDQGVRHAECTCNDEYDHEHCDHHVECTNALGGKCVNGECHLKSDGTPECKCANGHYSGTLCDIDDRCTNVECGHGHCVGDDPGNNHHCKCDAGWKGSDCNTVNLEDHETTPTHLWQKYLLDRHNYLRSIVGKVKNSDYYNGRSSEMQSKLNKVDSINKPATNMKKMLWSAALEANMKKHFDTKGCKMSHSSSSFRKNIPYKTNHPNADTSATFSYAGENLAMGGGAAYKYTEDSCTGDSCGSGENRIVDMWFDEVEYFNVNSNSCDEDGTCGHYTQVVWADSKYLGCAWCTSGSKTYWGCQYGPGGNYNGQVPYKKKSSGTTDMIEIDNSDWMIADGAVSSGVSFTQRHSSIVVIVGVVVAVAVVAVVVAAVVVKRSRSTTTSEESLETELCEEQ